MPEISTSLDIVHDHGHTENVNLPHPVSSSDLDDPSDLPRTTPRWRTIKWTPYRLFFPFSAILFGASKFVLAVAGYNTGSGVIELCFGVVLALVFWAGGLMEPAAPRVGLWGWFFHRNYGRVVRKVVWSISALWIVILAPFWMMVKIASAMIFACSRSPVFHSDRWHQLEELEHGHYHREHEELQFRSQTTTHHPRAHNDSLQQRHPDPSHSRAELSPRWLDVAYSTTIYFPYNHNDSLRQRHPDSSHSRAEPDPQWPEVAYVSDLEFPLIPSAAPIVRPQAMPIYFPDDMGTTDLAPSLKGGQCKSVRSKRAPGGRRVFYLGRRVGAQPH
ncbi:uncharacterized protein STEHIDRAFT_166761 [Stereum hirsutum FP-91666 SS1]|uniref:uncharacterized protein n=1 Tax=Stereum hirsutum (strain FP-91666) TaxID=721885 RepID=UPI000440D4B6|nr:uncharacterized protein STEHIDRAFT_166761 [Stereum hirsutum FP-91666 SS1]EIM88753.1 hypothetical protein STEHIDRAFT_166761 [Stereum hirsutum FP-91666 SS1]